MRRPAGAATVVVVVLALVLGTACGVPVDRHARPIPDDRVPFDLLDPTLGGGTTTVPAPAATPVTVFLVAGDRLLAASRSVAGPMSPARALEALLAGVTADEAVRGVRTAILPAARPVVTGVVDGEARVDLGPAMPAVDPKDLVLSAAQVVYTLTALPGVGSVAFTVAGGPAVLPTPDGTSKAGSLRRSAYAAVANL